VLAGGAVHTPQLLLLSGVGPAAALAAAGIPLVVNAPGVGANLQDHPAALVTWSLKPSAGRVAITDQLMHPSGRLRARAVLAYALAGRGPLATTGCDRGAFVRTAAATGADPDLQVRFVPAAALNPDGISSYIEFGRLASLGRRWPTGVTMQLLGVRPASRGTVTLRSADPWDAPCVDPGYLTDARGADAGTLREGVALARRVAGGGPLAGLIESELHPGAGASTDADVDEYVRLTLHSGNAVVGTAALGDVVDASLRVRGVAGLRVADASVMPVVPGGQTGAAALAIAERAAVLLGAPAALGVQGAGGAAAGLAPALAAA
jgi:choline dehydrogenase-like flavoprotein